MDDHIFPDPSVKVWSPSLPGSIKVALWHSDPSLPRSIKVALWHSEEGRGSVQDMSLQELKI